MKNLKNWYNSYKLELKEVQTIKIKLQKCARLLCLKWTQSGIWMAFCCTDTAAKRRTCACRAAVIPSLLTRQLMRILLALKDLCESKLYSLLWRTFGYSANIGSTEQKGPSRDCDLSPIKLLYFHHEKHVTADELREWHLKQAKRYWISSPW